MSKVGTSGYTVLVMGFDIQSLCVVVDPVYVPEATMAEEAGKVAEYLYKKQTGIEVQALYAASGDIPLVKLKHETVVV